MALAGCAERSIKLRSHARRSLQQPIVAQAHREQPRSAHRTNRVRTRRADADLEQVEDADCHPLPPRPASLQPRDSTPACQGPRAQRLPAARGATVFRYAYNASTSVSFSTRNDWNGITLLTALPSGRLP